MLRLFVLLPWLLIETAGAQYFEDISQSAGVDDLHVSTTFGVGQAWIDVERDGDLDLFVSNHGGPNHLYINQGDETFIEPPEFANLAMPDDICNGVAIADYDNDGWQDIFVACDGPNRLFHNLAGKAFEEVGAAAGVDNSNTAEVAAWADINNDGFVDLYVVNRGANAGPTRTTPAGPADPPDALFINQGDGTFVDIASELDAGELTKPGLAVTFLDFDFDGDLDLYVVNDRHLGNTLWRNDGPPQPDCGPTWCFTDVSLATGAYRPVDGMGIAVADYDQDGDEDLFFSSTNEQVLLSSQLAQGSLTYAEVSVPSGLHYAATGWATLFLDVENDTWPDAYVATWNLGSHDMDELFINQRDGTFLAVGANSGIQTATWSEGAAVGDFNNDGLPDVVVTDSTTQYRLFKNISISSNNWVSFELKGTSPINRDAIGATVEIELSDGRSFRRTLVSGGSRGSGNALRLHFGLANTTIVSAAVRWPDGKPQPVSAQVNTLNEVSYNPPEMLLKAGFE